MPLSEITEFKNGDHFSKKHASANIDNNMNHLYVYLDIVESQFVGDSFAPLLRTVNISGKKDETVLVNFRPFYKTVCRTEFDTINVSVQRVW